MAKHIRSATFIDADAISGIYAPFVTDRATSFEAIPPDAAEFVRRIAAQETTHPWLVFERDGRVRGYAYASSHQPRAAYKWSVNVSVYIEPEAHRSGVGRALYTALFEVLRRQHYVTAYAGITLPNAGSEALHRSMGFRPVGVFEGVGFKMGKWHDVMWLSLRLREATVPPLGPVPLAQVWQDQDLAGVLTQAAAIARD